MELNTATDRRAEDPGTRDPGQPLTACSAVASGRWEKHEDAGPVSSPSAESGSPGDGFAGSTQPTELRAATKQLEDAPAQGSTP